MKRSIRFLLTASVLTAGLMFSAASAMAETSEEKGPGINMGASGTAAVTGEAPDGSAKETGDAADNKPGTAETTESAEGSASASGSAAAEDKDPAAAWKASRKTPEELQEVMAVVPAGPAKAEWGTFFLGNNLPPQNDEDEAYLRSFHAYAMVPTQEKIAYLTFDEGYENGYTPAILDILAKHNVKAAFFCTGSFIKESPELVKRFYDEGHIIGNHTLTHPSMMKVSSWSEFYRQLMGVEELVKAITGEDMPRYYRPPSGGYSEAQLRMAGAMGFRTVFWSVAYKDWDTSAQPTHERGMNYLTTRIHPGAIILLHAVSKTNTEILDDLLTTWENMGYTFHTLDELPEGLY